MDSKKIVIGSVIGGAIGAVAVAMLANNYRRRSSFTEIAEEYGDKIKSAVGDIADFDMSNIIETLKDQILDLPDMDNRDFLKGIMVGAALGSVLGCGATSLMQGNNGKKIKSFTKNIMESVDEVRKTSKSTAQDFMDLATAGIKCWNTFTR